MPAWLGTLVAVRLAAQGTHAQLRFLLHCHHVARDARQRDRRQRQPDQRHNLPQAHTDSSFLQGCHTYASALSLCEAANADEGYIVTCCGECAHALIRVAAEGSDKLKKAYLAELYVFPVLQVFPAKTCMS